MAPGEHRVAIVVTATPSEHLQRLALERHVWVVRSPESEAAARQIWDTGTVYTLDRGITIFNGAGNSAEEDCIDISGRLTSTTAKSATSPRYRWWRS